MALGTYTAILGTPADWLHRSDLTTSQAADWVDLFEASFNATNRVRQMETEATYVATSGFVNHPTNWLQWKELRCTYNGSTYNLEPVTDEAAVLRTYGESATAVPRYYKVKGSKTYLYPTAPGASIITTYYAGVGLDGTTNTNWLLNAYPGAYLYGTLLQATAYTGDDPRIPMWQSALQQTLAEIKADSRKSEWSGQVLKMQSDLRTLP